MAVWLHRPTHMWCIVLSMMLGLVWAVGMVLLVVLLLLMAAADRAVRVLLVCSPRAVRVVDVE